ncbi:MAG: transketolase [Candidatus Neomarinimicrobiota bacterium]|nr:MAG: transketolase [Candidatus Neomarinimicrobiota bacterium]
MMIRMPTMVIRTVRSKNPLRECINKKRFMKPSLTKDRIRTLEKKSRQIRLQCIQMAHNARESHVKGALSCVDILIMLFHEILRYDPQHYYDSFRDRFIFSKGHAAAALYAVLADADIIANSLLSKYGKSNSPLPSHPCKHMLNVLDWSSGSLGHGLGVGTGMAYALKLKDSTSSVFVLLSDGECNEGSTWEAAQFARAQHLDNLVAIVDYNGSQSIGYTDNLLGDANLAAKFQSFGWSVRECDGHSFQELWDAFQESYRDIGRPTAIIARTNPGKGLSFLTDHILWHYRTPSEEEVHRAEVELSITSTVVEV